MLLCFPERFSLAFSRRLLRTIIIAACSAGCGTALAQTAAPALKELSQLLRARQYQAAVERADALLQGAPRDAQVRFVRALALSELGRQDDAIAALLALTAEFPELPEPYNNLAVLYAARGNYAEAQRMLEQAVHNLPGFATAHENLGDLYVRLAAQSYERAARLEKLPRPAAGKLARLTPVLPAVVEQAKLAARAEADLPTGQELPVRTPAVCPPVETAAAVPAAVPVARPESKTESRPAAAKMPADQIPAESQAILAALQAWTRAWSSKNVDAYLAHYAPEFAPANGEPRAAWESARRERISKPKTIQVEAANPRLTILDATTAKVAFMQNYKAASLQVATAKTLTFVKSGGRWLIAAEEGGH